MKEFFQKIAAKIKGAWGKWTLVQKLIFGGIILAVVAAFVALGAINSAPASVPIFNAAVSDENLQGRIATRLDADGIPYTRSADGGMFYAPDVKTARKARALLVREDLAPGNLDPWALFDVQRWTTTQFLDDVNLQRSLTNQLKMHIESLDDIDAANVTLAMPKDALFKEDQAPVTVSVIITPKPGSDIETNQKKLRGITKLIQFAVPNLKEDNITLTDNFGKQLNDFGMMDAQNRLEIGLAELEQKKRMEREDAAKIQNALHSMLPGRVMVLNVDVTLNTDEEESNGTRVTPIIMKDATPGLPYDDSQRVESIRISEQSANVTFKGTGINPQGPAGQEGQTPPAYQDLQNANGEYEQNTNTSNYIVNQENYSKRKRPWILERKSIAVAIDGTWELEYDDNGQPIMDANGGRQRRYVAPDAQTVAKVQSLVEGAVGYNGVRGDIVAVSDMQFDRRAQFAEEDELYRKRLLTAMIIRWSLAGLAALVVIFMVYRAIAREIARRHREREEELARQHQAMREAALRSLEEQSEPEMSPRDRARQELQENAMNMAREHPEEVAQLIRTWLSED